MESSKLSRRGFLGWAAKGAAGLTLASVASSSFGVIAPGSKALYRLVLLGDMHYDRLEHHDMTWLQANYPNDLNQIYGYVSNTANHTPLLLSRIKNLILYSELPIPYVLQLGDFVEGLCGSYDLAATQFRDAMAAIDQAKLGVPLLICKGNHDVTGPGAADAYQNVLLPWMSNRNGMRLTTPNFTVRYRDDLFVFFDAYKPDLDWLQAEFTKNADARHTFFLIHEPVVPYNARANWIVYYNSSQSSQRQQLLGMLGQRKAIVLSGHLHKYGFVEYATPQGSFTQLAVSSVVTNDHPTAKTEMIGVPAYTPDLVNLEPSFDPATLTERMQFLAAEQPNIRQYEYADLSGFAVLDVYATGVICQYYGGINTSAYRSPSIKAD